MLNTNGLKPLLAGGRPINTGPFGSITLPVASFSFTGSGTNRSFTDTSVGGTYAITTYLWDFGDSTTSNAPNPSHTFAAGATYAVTLTITDSAGNQSSATESVVIQSNTQFGAEVDSMIANIIPMAQRTGIASVGLGHQEVLTSATSQQLIADQQTDGSFPSYQGAAPTSSNRESMYYIENFYRAYLRKLVFDYKYGTYDPTLQGSTTAKAAIWRAIKGSAFWIENYYYYGRPSWTPAKWWGPQAIGWVLIMMVDDFIADRTTALTDGETIERSVQRIADVLLGMGPSFNTDGSEYITEINMSGSPDNGSGANLFGPNSTLFILGVFIGKINGDSTVMDFCRGECIRAYSFGWGKYFYVLDDQGGTDIQDYVGINPGPQLAAHNGGGSSGKGGAKNQHLRYGYSLVRNSNDLFEITRGTSFFLPQSQLEIIVQCYEAAMLSSIRSVTNNASGGRFMFNLGLPGKPGSWAINAQDLVNFSGTSLNANQIARLDKVDEICRRRNITPDVEGTINAWSCGDLTIATGDRGGPNGGIRTEYSLYYMFGRAGSQDNIQTAIAGMTSREQSPAELNINYGDGYGIVLHGSTNPEGSDFNFGQFENLCTGDPAIGGPHGSVYVDTIAGLPNGSNSDHPPSNALDQVQVVKDFDFQIGATFDKTNSWYNHTYQGMKAGFHLKDDHPTLTQWTHVVFEMMANLQVQSTPQAALKHNIVYSFHVPVTCNFDGTTDVVYGVDTDSTATFSSVTNGIIWAPTSNDVADYPYGRGTIILGTHDLEFDVVANGGAPDPGALAGGRFRVKIDHGTAPSGASSVFITIPKCTLADLKEIRDNFSTYFEYVNTATAQWVRFKPTGKTVGAIWAANEVVQIGSGTTAPATFTAADSIGFVIEENGADYSCGFARNRWRDTLAPESGGALQETTLTFSDKGAVQFEWAKDFVTLDRDPTGQGVGNPSAKPPGFYYSGATKLISI